MTLSAPLSGLKAAESRLAKAVAAFVPELGLNRQSVEAGARSLGLSEGERDLIAPHGAADIAAILWREHDENLLRPETAESLAGMKIREKIAFLLNTRLDAAAHDEKLARRLMGYFALPHHAALYHRLLWQTADIIWRLAGDTALDENHYSKRMIVSGIITTAMMTRLSLGGSLGREAQLEQIDRNIEQVMQFEKFKAKLPVKPEEIALNLARTLGRLRFGQNAA
ncbi:COQ9 family protein [Asticcacaulis taihuensis]|uniref:Ubiquinone biosynthesis protein COQ9 n=1 Tax=Asticcacaulis taihuensis TaxID=260084 RepID=A0A1G4Q3G4_9CAUL|nr:COQ9 family protein [Asticcacaulis taihuensis]SCW39140.1 ubiquinone biosynthesis protein COQ9 [Asticcacaulis taihuensis]